LSYAIYRFVPLLDFEGPDDGFGDFSNRLERLKVFFDAYGASREELNGYRSLDRSLEGDAPSEPV
jgi:hypothetical protein